MHCNPGIIPPFYGWTDYTPTLPNMYWDVYSHEERIKKMCLNIHKLIAYCTMNAEHLNIALEEVEKLKELFEKFQESGFDDYYREQVEKWIDEHTRYIFENVAKQVWFGLTDDGYFCAYIPDGWQDIQFDTGAAFGTPEYGRLILQFEAEPVTD